MGASFSKTIVAAAFLPLAAQAFSPAGECGFTARFNGLTFDTLMGNLQTQACYSHPQDASALIVRGLNLGTLPQEFIDLIKSMTELRHVNLSENKLTSFPEGLFTKENHPYLESINIQGQLLTELPAGFMADIPTLKYLDVKHNALDGLPDGILGNSPDMREVHLIGQFDKGGALGGVPAGMMDNKPNLEKFVPDIAQVRCSTLGDTKTSPDATCTAITGTRKWENWNNWNVWVTDPLIAPKVWSTGSDGTTVYKCDDSEDPVCLENTAGQRHKWAVATVPDSVTLATNNTAFDTGDGSWEVNEESMRFSDSAGLNFKFPWNCACN